MWHHYIYIDILIIFVFRCVIVIAGRSREEIRQEEKARWEDMSIEDHMEHYISQGLDRKEAMKKVAKDRGVQKREIYNYLEKQKS